MNWEIMWICIFQQATDTLINLKNATDKSGKT